MPKYIKAEGNPNLTLSKFVPIAVNAVATSMARIEFTKSLSVSDQARMSHKKIAEMADSYAMTAWEKHVSEASAVAQGMWALMNQFQAHGISFEEFFTASPNHNEAIQKLVATMDSQEKNHLDEALSEVRKKVEDIFTQVKGTSNSANAPISSRPNIGEAIYKVVSSSETKEDALAGIEALLQSAHGAEKVFIKLVTKQLMANSPLTIPGHGSIDKFVISSETKNDALKTGSSN